MKYLFLVLILISCDPVDNRLTVLNKTNQNLVICDRLYPFDNNDLNKIAIDNFDFYEYQVSPYKTKKMIKKGNWDMSFKSDTLVILIYNKDSIINRRLQNPSKNYVIQQIIHVSHKFVQNNNWEIIIDSLNNSRIIKL
jgi:hypothetical protein